MEIALTGTVFVPGLVTLAFLLVFAYLQRQSSERYFRNWQWIWLANTGYYILEGIRRTQFGRPAYAAFVVLVLFCGVFVLFVFVRAFSRTEPPT